MSPRGIELKSVGQIGKMRRAGMVVAQIHDAIRAAAKPGVTTGDLDLVAARVLEGANARSNFLGYHGFPAHTCLSVNDEVVHGIPGERVLQDGDVLSADCGAVLDGWHADAAFSMVLGAGADADHTLVQVAEDAMWAGIAALAGAKRVHAVGKAVEKDVRRARSRTGLPLGIVTEYVGHGIGSALHQPPDVPNVESKDKGPKVRPGLCVAIEPMLTLGESSTRLLPDGWTVVTADGARAAHAEHTVAVHEGGIWVLTAPDGGAQALGELGVEVAALG